MSIVTIEAEYAEAQLHLVEVLTRLRLAQQQHDRLFGKGAYVRAVAQLASAAAVDSLSPPDLT